MSGDCETGGPHNVEELADMDGQAHELRCVECCRVWAPLDVSMALSSALSTAQERIAKLEGALRELRVWLRDTASNGAMQCIVDRALSDKESGT